MQIQQRNLPEAPMKNRRKKSTSGNSFSFPCTPNPDSDFEFGSLTPDSPSSDPCITSPADHLFLNGRLQPHSFPLFLPQQHHNHNHPIPMTSRTSSISSKDSLVSSRSNSTNSRGSISSCSSARTSSSDRSDTRLLHSKISSLSSSCKGTFMVKKSMVYSAHHQVYGCSQRWQYITQVPALERNASRRRNGESQQKRKKKKEKTARGFRFRFGLRMFRWFVMACKQCHAMEPSKGCNKEIITYSSHHYSRVQPSRPKPPKANNRSCCFSHCLLLRATVFLRVKSSTTPPLLVSSHRSSSRNTTEEV